MHSVEVQNMTKVYSTSLGRKKVTALKDFNLQVPKGTVFGLLGPNGAGKTTLVKILLGITHATAGTGQILGEKIQNYKVKTNVGYLPENHRYPPYLTGEQVLRFFAQLSGYENENLEKRIDELLHLVKIQNWKKAKIKTYSKGMMQRLGLAQALINDPELIFLDEPTDGVDPIGRKEIRDILLEQKEMGKTIFLNSHLLSEVEMITDRVAILNKGTLLKEGTIEELTHEKQKYDISIDTEVTDDLLNNSFADFKLHNKNGKGISADLADSVELNKLIDKIRSEGIAINSIIPRKSSLEDYFITIINQDENNGI